MGRFRQWVAWLRLEPEDIAPLLAPVFAVFIAVAAYDLVFPDLPPSSMIWARLGLAIAIWGAIHLCLMVAAQAWRRVLQASRRDASARERALISELAEAQEQAQARLGRIVAGAPVGIATVGADGVVESWNPAAAEILGRRTEDVIGRPISVIIPRVHAAVPHPDGGAVLADFVAAAGRVRGVTKAGTAVELRLRVIAGSDMGRPVYTAFFERLPSVPASTRLSSTPRAAA